MERETVIKIENVKKQYRLGTIGGGTLRGDLQSWWARKRGKEDPNLKIGQEAYTTNEKFYALNGISFEVYKGERLGIIGGNGAGKSTTLKLLSRVTAPTEGNIYIKGRISSMLEVGTGFHPELTGRENIYLNGAILGMSKAEVDSKIEDIIDFSECRQFIDTPVKRYSSGMYVKLAFSVAAHLDSEVLIMDEVLAVGDMKFQQKCLKKMSEVAEKEGRTVLYVSHNMNTIRQLCDRCIVLDHGKVIYIGDVESAINIYLGNSVNLQQVTEFSSKDHEKWCKQYIFIKKVRIINDITTIYINDYISFELDIHAKFSIDNLRARLVILDDNLRIIGMAISNNLFSVKQNMSKKITFKFKTNGLSKGKYLTRFSIFNLNEFGNQEYYCVINNFFTFELNDMPKYNFGMNWDSKSWGNIAFTPFEIEVK
ncbi:ABC transporter ATP-binding protein [uncultured Thomasclavelia sp.]|uniref:ABC transporter ATP-binding protein n=1 Tax=uncultured Thomasclavelia sp. TaxID=3025759 RepID=UPI00260B611A|nr:ABC transporter ATP-binding protein [uncultured Thomasclavelia sp.]